MASQKDLSPEYLAADIGDRLTGVAGAMLPIVLLFLGLRFYSRHLTRAPWGLDDALAIISGLISVGLSALAICFVRYGGVGHHLDALKKEEPQLVPQYFKYLLVVSTYYYSTVAIPKLAVLALYGRLWTVNPYRTIILILAAIIILTAVVSGIMCLNMCQPFEFNWDQSIPGGHCLDKQAFFTWASLPNILTDLVMLVLPVPVVWNLNTSMKVKLGLIFTFATGILGLVTSIMRFVIFTRGNAVTDGSWSSTDLMSWSVAEPDIYLISACLPTLRPLLNRIFGRDGSTNQSSRYANGYGGGAGSAVNSKPTAVTMDSTLYGDEVQLVSIVGKQGSESRDGPMERDHIYVQREVNVKVSNDG
ncbi:hypothetical protein NUU61_003518 [Penicillium alfredii]|uniref:Rhodopsin domain-containing protein n=1 Tax=Penicillium alfredii TaxID=1506179 RepID=A0A9W9KD05_9EURO|nr:uncharacterized protein NUU61_003518 [Penicillium alfredii]KAJ5101296.1 hypothetical protein NUU61_003518 [Penicillium alfredii]